MNVLVDTPVWVDHFRNSNSNLIHLIALDQVLVHSMALAELACGTPPAPRKQSLDDMALLRPAHEASMRELMALIEREKLYGRLRLGRSGTTCQRLYHARRNTLDARSPPRSPSKAHGR